jgi:hypothetical protein
MMGRPRNGISKAREGIRPTRFRTQLLTCADTYTRVLNAARMASDTERLLSDRGWCLWRCESLDNDVIAVVRDDNIHDVYGTCITYTEEELRRLFNERRPVDLATLRLIHEAKRCGMLQSKHVRDSFGNKESYKEAASPNTNYGMNLAMALF